MIKINTEKSTVSLSELFWQREDFSTHEFAESLGVGVRILARDFLRLAGDHPIVGPLAPLLPVVNLQEVDDRDVVALGLIIRNNHIPALLLGAFGSFGL